MSADTTSTKVDVLPTEVAHTVTGENFTRVKQQTAKVVGGRKRHLVILVL